jgi:hypothetical protein
MVTKNPTAPSSPRGKLELTWTNKHLRLIDDLGELCFSGEVASS